MGNSFFLQRENYLKKNVYIYKEFAINFEAVK